jgi:P pilus assembly chaperone PapD
MLTASNRRFTLVLSIALAMAVAGSLGVAPPTAASVGVGVTPSLLELAAPPGGTGKAELVVSSTGDQPTEVTVTAESLEDTATTNTAVAWLKVSPANFLLAPGKEQKVTVSIDLPDDLESGGYYAAVAVTTGAADRGATGTAVAAQVRVPFLFTVQGAGDLTRSALIERFAPVLEVDGRIGFRALVRNNGNVHIQAQGNVEITNPGGQHYASLDIPDSGRILPNSAKLIKGQGSVPVQAGHIYDAMLTLAYGDTSKPLTVATTFIATPPVLLLDELSVCENLDRGPSLSIGLRNEGQVGVLPAVDLQVRTAAGEVVGELAVPASSILVWPSGTDTFQFDFPQRLESGQYVFAVTARLGTDSPVTKDVPFQIGGIEGTSIPLCPAPLATVAA